MEKLCVLCLEWNTYSMVFSENNIFLIQQFTISRYQEKLEAEFRRSICMCTFLRSLFQELEPWKAKWIKYKVEYYSDLKRKKIDKTYNTPSTLRAPFFLP